MGEIAIDLGGPTIMTPPKDQMCTMCHKQPLHDNGRGARVCDHCDRVCRDPECTVTECAKTRMDKR